VITPSEAAGELLARRKARRSIADYIQYTFPSYRHSAFSDAVCMALDKFIEEVQGGKRPILVLQAPPQHGKALAIDTPIPTPAGWEKIGHLVIGDEVFDENGSVCRVTGKSPVWHDRPTFSVTTDDGDEIIADAAHEWEVRLCRKQKALTLRSTQYLANRTSKRNPLIKHAGPIECPLAVLPIDPYVLGVWLGDGTSAHATITASDDDTPWTRGEIERLGYRTANRKTHNTFGIFAVTPILKRMNLLRNKHIPGEYLRASKTQRLSLLQGLMDTDGYVGPKGQVEFCSTNLSLALGVQELVRSLGAKANMATSRARLYGKDCGAKYRVSFYLDSAARMPRKAIKCRSGHKHPGTYITVTSAGVRDTVCIQVDSPSHLFLAGRSMTPTHNSEIVSRKLPAYLLSRFPQWRIGAASYADSLANTMAQSVRINLASPEHQRLFPLAIEKRKFALDRMGEFTSPGGTGSYVGVGVGAGLTGRPVDVGIVDDPTKGESEALSETVKESQWNWYQAVFSTRLSQNSGQIVMATSWAMDDLPGRILEMYRGNPRLTHLRFPAINLPDEVGYNSSLPAGALVPELHSLEKLQETKGLLSDYWWAALYQQSPRALGGNVFKESGIQYYLPKDLPKKWDKVITSWDCTFKDTDGTDFVVGQVWGRAGANTYLLDQMRKRMSFTATVAAVIELQNRWPKSCEVLIEDKANGPAVIDTLKAHVPGIIPIEPDGSKLARAHAVTSYWEALNVWIPDAAIAPWIVPFISEITSFPAAAHDDQVDSMTQALRRLYPLFGRLLVSQAAIDRALGLVQ